MFLTIFTWWLWLELLGLIALPLAFNLFKNLPDKGYPLAKTLGILVLSYLLWLGASLHVLAFRRWSIALLLLILAVAAVLLARRQWASMRAFFRVHWRVIAITEMIFAGGIVGWSVIRAYNPFMQLPEHAMNFAFINTILRSAYMPPPDPWLAGYPLNYYYFGHFIMATLTELSGIPVYVTYNLAIGLIFSLAAMGVFSLTFNLTRGDSEHPASLRKAVFAGCAAIVFLLLVGNLEGTLEFMYAHNIGSPGFWNWIGIKGLTAPYSSAHWYPTETDWWVRAVRVLDTLTPEGGSLDLTLNDGVFFNLLVGYPHAHLMAVPFALLAGSFSLALFRGDRPAGWDWLKKNWLFFTLALVSVGALGPINSWDLATWGIMLVTIICVQGYITREPGSRWWLDTGVVAAAAFIGMFLLYIPYYNTYQAYGNLRPWLGPSARPLHQFLLLGFPASIGIAYLLWRSPRVLKKVSWKMAIVAVLPVAVPFAAWVFLGRKETPGPYTPSIPTKLLTAAPLLVVAVLTLFVLLFYMGRRTDHPNRSAMFQAVCLFTGFLITYGVELFYFQDAILGGRGNTVFKFYYHVWLLLAIAAGYGFYYLVFVWKPRSFLLKIARGSWWAIFLLLFAGSLIYPVAATLTKTNFFKGQPTLDGLSFLPPADRELLDWFSNNVKGTPVIAEASNIWSLEESRMSVRTGLPTIMGWVLHEKGWRGPDDRDFMARVKDLEVIYQNEDLFKVQALLDKYQVRYIVVGWVENQRYGAGIRERFDGWFERAFANSAGTVYKVSPAVWQTAKNARGTLVEMFYKDPYGDGYYQLANSVELPQDTYHLSARVKNPGTEKVTVYLEVTQSDGVKLVPLGAPEWELSPGGEVGLFMQGANLKPAGKTVQMVFNLKEKGSNKVLDTKVINVRSK